MIGKIGHFLDPATDEDAMDCLCPQWCSHMANETTRPYCKAFEAPIRRTRDGWLLRLDDCMASDLIDTNP